jgi:hypothetical protein
MSINIKISTYRGINKLLTHPNLEMMLINIKISPHRGINNLLTHPFGEIKYFLGL